MDMTSRVFQQVSRHGQKGGNRRNRAVDRARRNDVQTVPPQVGDADSKNLRSRSAPLSQLQETNADHIDPRGRPDSQKDSGAPRSLGYAKSRPARRRKLPYRRTRLRRFGLSNPAIRLLGLSRFPHPKKIEVRDRRRTATRKGPSFIFSGLSPTFRKPFSIHRPSFPFSFRFGDHPSAHRRNMLQRWADAGGRETIEKHGVVSLTKSKFLSLTMEVQLETIPLPVQDQAVIPTARGLSRKAPEEEIFSASPTSKISIRPLPRAEPDQAIVVV